MLYEVNSTVTLDRIIKNLPSAQKIRLLNKYLYLAYTLQHYSVIDGSATCKKVLIENLVIIPLQIHETSQIHTAKILRRTKVIYVSYLLINTSTSLVTCV